MLNIHATEKDPRVSDQNLVVNISQLLGTLKLASQRQKWMVDIVPTNFDASQVPDAHPMTDCIVQLFNVMCDVHI